MDELDELGDLNELDQFDELDEFDEFNELDEFIDSMNNEQIEGIDKFFRTMPKLSHTIKFQKDNEKHEVELSGLQSFFGQPFLMIIW